MKYLI